MLLLLVALAAGFGAAAGLLVPRPAYRLSVESGTPWRTACPSGHPLRTGPGGWLGAARCAACAAVTVPGPRAAAAPPESAPLPGAVSGGPAYGPHAVPLAVTGALAAAALACAVGPRPELGVWLLLVPAGILLAVVDRAVHRLPDVLTLPLAAVALGLLGLAAAHPEAAGSWTGALLGGLALGGGYFVLFLAHPNGMGFGDVKLAVTLGVALGWYGWGVLFTGAFAGFLYGAVYGFALLVRGRAGRRTAMPFGPFMIAGAFTGLLLGGMST
ncbi:prepilin peptidase [Streptomyces sp. GC420]|uniref:prepilin peptidase n=1 Tax=Streptomyces sp. GC420 TaxID=2697568 RepID=UPI0014150133|nr:prepilin peptidase [Streptomyces sp. GC420]NBM17317.1 prepilin peptidase [Streptomyces sp. GC420]